MLERQVRRMLADPKAQALVDNFAGQWLQLRNLQSKQPNSHEFPDFDDNLREALQTETELFFASIMREDRSVARSDDGRLHVRQRAAGAALRHPERLRQPLPPRDAHRRRAARACSGKGAILMVTSHAHRTSPVLRGKWVLENLLGTPPPPPPDVVPPFEEETERGQAAIGARADGGAPAQPGVRQLPPDDGPAGLALENFDAVGAWRTRDGGTRGTPIDASGQLVDGTRSTAWSSCGRRCCGEPEIFVATVTEKLLTYALGRGLTAPDMPAVRAIVRDAARDDYRFSSLVLGIVSSVPFQMRIKGPGRGGVAGAAVRPESSLKSELEQCRRLVRGDEERHVHHQDVVVAADLPAGHGRHPGAAAARRDGAGADAHVAHGRGARRAASARSSCRWASGPSHWTPATTGAGFEFSPILKPLEPFRDHVDGGLQPRPAAGRARTPSAPARG